MAEEKDDSDKAYEPSEHKLRKAREKGNIPVSNEVNVFISLVFYNILFISIFFLFKHIYVSIKPFIEHFNNYDLSSIGGISYISIFLLKHVFLLIIAIIIVIAIAPIIGTLMQTKLNVALEKIKFKASNISFKKGIEKIFSVKAIIEFVKSIFKTVVFCVVIYFIIKNYVKDADKYICMTLWAELVKAGSIIAKVLGIFTIIIFLFAIADYFIKKFMYMKEMRMSFKEMKDENKESEGDPQIKAKLRQIRMKRSKERVSSAVKDSTFVVTNPTHFAVAVKYDPESEGAPVVTAKGADFMAQAIKSVAKENNVPIFENKPLARSLYASIEVGEEIPETEYAAVAAIIRKVMNIG